MEGQNGDNEQRSGLSEAYLPYQLGLNTASTSRAPPPNQNQPRRRKPEDQGRDGEESQAEAAGLYNDLERLRSLVDGMENGNSSSRPSSCFKLSLDNSMMSTIFGLVFVVILTVTFYAFYSLYRALVKRFFPG